MKKFFIFLSVLIGIVLVAVLILGVIEPTDIIVTRSTIIKAPKDVVFDQMAMFKNWTHWSPWYKMDSNNMKITYTGIDGQPGSGYSWVGSGKTGAGSMVNKQINGTEMDFEVNFTAPQSGKAQAMLKAEDSVGYTRATWTFDMHIPFPMNAMCAFMHMDKLLGGDFENGLSNMKTYLESNVHPSSVMDVENVMYPGHVYEGVRQKVNWNEMDKFFMDNAVMLKKGAGDKISGPAVELLFGWDTATKQGDIMVAFPVSDSATPAVLGARYINVDASKAYRVVHKGPYSVLPDIHIALQRYIAEQMQRPLLIFEEYEVGAIEQPDSNKWVTNIYYLVK